MQARKSSQKVAQAHLMRDEYNSMSIPTVSAVMQ